MRYLEFHLPRGIYLPRPDKPFDFSLLTGNNEIQFVQSLLGFCAQCDPNSLNRNGLNDNGTTLFQSFFNSEKQFAWNFLKEFQFSKQPSLIRKLEEVLADLKEQNYRFNNLAYPVMGWYLGKPEMSPPLCLIQGTKGTISVNELDRLFSLPLFPCGEMDGGKTVLTLFVDSQNLFQLTLNWTKPSSLSAEFFFPALVDVASSTRAMKPLERIKFKETEELRSSALLPFVGNSLLTEISSNQRGAERIYQVPLLNNAALIAGCDPVFLGKLGELGFRLSYDYLSRKPERGTGLKVLVSIPDFETNEMNFEELEHGSPNHDSLLKDSFKIEEEWELPVRSEASTPIKVLRTFPCLLSASRTPLSQYEISDIMQTYLRSGIRLFSHQFLFDRGDVPPDETLYVSQTEGIFMEYLYVCLFEIILLPTGLVLVRPIKPSVFKVNWRNKLPNRISHFVRRNNADLRLLWRMKLASLGIMSSVSPEWRWFSPTANLPSFMGSEEQRFQTARVVNEEGALIWTKGPVPIASRIIIPPGGQLEGYSIAHWFHANRPTEVRLIEETILATLTPLVQESLCSSVNLTSDQFTQSSTIGDSVLLDLNLTTENFLQAMEASFLGDRKPEFFSYEIHHVLVYQSHPLAGDSPTPDFVGRWLVVKSDREGASNFVVLFGVKVTTSTRPLFVSYFLTVRVLQRGVGPNQLFKSIITDELHINIEEIETVPIPVSGNPPAQEAELIHIKCFAFEKSLVERLMIGVRGDPGLSVETSFPLTIGDGRGVFVPPPPPFANSTRANIPVERECWLDTSVTFSLDYSFSRALPHEPHHFFELASFPKTMTKRDFFEFCRRGIADHDARFLGLKVSSRIVSRVPTRYYSLFRDHPEGEKPVDFVTQFLFCLYFESLVRTNLESGTNFDISVGSFCNFVTAFRQSWMLELYEEDNTTRTFRRKPAERMPWIRNSSFHGKGLLLSIGRSLDSVNDMDWVWLYGIMGEHGVLHKYDTLVTVMGEQHSVQVPFSFFPHHTQPSVINTYCQMILFPDGEMGCYITNRDFMLNFSTVLSPTVSLREARATLTLNTVFFNQHTATPLPSLTVWRIPTPPVVPWFGKAFYFKQTLLWSNRNLNYKIIYPDYRRFLNGRKTENLTTDNVTGMRIFAQNVPTELFPNSVSKMTTTNPASTQENEINMWRSRIINGRLKDLPFVIQQTGEELLKSVSSLVILNWVNAAGESKMAFRLFVNGTGDYGSWWILHDEHEVHIGPVLLRDILLHSELQGWRFTNVHGIQMNADSDVIRFYAPEKLTPAPNFIPSGDLTADLLSVKIESLLL
jgi:hypothetical protein